MVIFKKVKDWVRISENDQQIAIILLIIATILLISHSLKSQEKFNKDEFKININKASQEELEELPGIGPTLAQRIIIYREEKGYFRSFQDILEVKGMGKKKLQKIISCISLSEKNNGHTDY